MSYYTKREVTPVTDPPAWENPDNTVRNLLIGSELVSISSVAPIDGETATPRYNTPDTEPQLTDGVISDVYDFNDPRWFRFTRGTGRAIVFRLGGLSAVSGFRIGFLKQDSAAVRLPRGWIYAAPRTGPTGSGFTSAAIYIPTNTRRESASGANSDSPAVRFT